MTKKSECRVVSNAIKAVVPGFQHKCNTSRHNVLRVRGSRIDDYCTAKNGMRTTTTLIPDQLYPICYQMKTQVINKLLPRGGGSYYGRGQHERNPSQSFRYGREHKPRSPRWWRGYDRRWRCGRCRHSSSSSSSSVASQSSRWWHCYGHKQ